MKNEMRFQLGALFFILFLMGISIWLGDWRYPIRIVQDGSHESLFILLGLVLGFTMQSRTDDDSISALICAIGMAVSSLLVEGLDIDQPNVAEIGFVLSGMFFITMLGTVVFLLRALRSRIRYERDATRLDGE
ncbi:hypothetical protein [Halomonas korlensis]|uniref:Uncharacterized protein n=1 Tax=Halomonas korlensis TaxID=463301 RepID=A0A1I7J417_9GAMM|nr:hypothetical protein [Halomonas korlensis]SFU79935.1 hypothetical protein SAMN04487955_10947 [Halomonas korlensis]